MISSGVFSDAVKQSSLVSTHTLKPLLVHTVDSLHEKLLSISSSSRRHKFVEMLFIHISKLQSNTRLESPWLSKVESWRIIRTIVNLHTERRAKQLCFVTFVHSVTVDMSPAEFPVIIPLYEENFRDVLVNVSFSKPP